MAKYSVLKKKVLEDLEESFESPKLNEQQRKESIAIFQAYRKKTESKRTQEDVIKIKLLQLKFLIEDYLKEDGYDRTKSFSYFFREYIDRQYKKSKDFAKEIDVKATVVSQLVNNHRDPNTEIMLRLEAHSNNIFPAIVWFKILSKDKEYLFLKDDEQRRVEQKHVKKRLEFTL